MTAVVELRKVTKAYQTGPTPFYAIKDVNLQIHPGEFAAIMGPSGSGKSTLMHLMGLLDVPTSGEIRVDDIPTEVLSEGALSRLRNEKVGFVFQSFNLLSRTSAIDNIALPLWYAPKPSKDTRDRAADAMRRVGMDPSTKGRNHPNQLSGGQQQMVAIGRALMTQPKLLLCDEISLGLAPKVIAEIYEMLPVIRQSGTAILLVEQDVALASRSSDRVYCILEGRITLTGKSSEVTRDEITQAYFGVKHEVG